MIESINNGSIAMILFFQRNQPQLRSVHVMEEQRQIVELNRAIRGVMYRKHGMLGAGGGVGVDGGAY